MSHCIDNKIEIVYIRPERDNGLVQCNKCLVIHCKIIINNKYRMQCYAFAYKTKYHNRPANTNHLPYLQTINCWDMMKPYKYISFRPHERQTILCYFIVDSMLNYAIGFAKIELGSQNGSRKRMVNLRYLRIICDSKWETIDFIED